MPLPRLSLQWKVPAFFILLVTIPLIVANVIWFISSRDELIRTTSAEEKSTVARAGNIVSDFFTTKEISLIIHSQTQGVINNDRGHIVDDFKNFLLQDQDIKELTLLNDKGMEIARDSRTKVYLESELKDRSSSEAFRVTNFVGGDHYIGQVIYTTDGTPIVEIAVAVVLPEVTQNLQNLTTSAIGRTRQAGEVKGALIEEVALTDLWKNINAIKISQHGLVYVADSSGVVLSHPDSSLIKKSAQNVPEVQSYLAGLSPQIADDITVSQAAGSRDQQSLVSSLVARPTNWGIFGEVPLSDILIQTNQVAILALLIFLVVATMASLLSLQLSQQITGPIAQLTQGAQVVGLGDLNYQIDVRTGDELEDLGRSFNLMSANLRDAFKNLEKDRSLISAERNKLAVILSGVVDGVIAVDLNREVILFNKAAEKITGYTEKEVVGQSLDNLIKLYREDSPVPVASYCPIRTDGFEGVVYDQKDLKVVGKSRHESFVNLMAGQIKEGAATNLGCILTLHDVTAERKLEEMKLDFVSMAAHELRTPLTSIKGYLSVFIKENKDKFNADQNMFMERISSSTDKLGSLIENLLNVTRIERGTLTVNLAPTDWLTIAQQVVTDFTDRAKEKELTLQLIEPAEELPKVAADKLRIGEVLSNLLANAITYTNPGGTVEVRIEVNPEEVVTYVKDSGIGIPASAILHLFTKFYRVSGALERGTKGTGLGLYISKSIIEAHHGRIWVDSKEDHGSTFAFSIPVARVAAAKAQSV